MSFSNEQWKAQQKNASRACFITIKNTTAVTLVRTNYHLQSGIWSCFPPEKIPPSTVVEFGSQSTGLMSGTDGYVQYKCSKEEEPFTFSWINSWWGTRKMSSSCPPKYKCIETGTMNNFAEMHWVVTYNEKYLKSSPIESCHKITSNAEQQLSASEKNSTHTPQIIPRDITSEWQNELVKAQRSVTVTIENKTKWVLKRRDQWITQGVWALFPAETIPPNQSTTFATMSHGWMTGTEGKLFYSIPGVKGDLIFYWCNLWLGDKIFKARGPPNVNIESIAIKNNQAKVTFYVVQSESEKPNESLNKLGTGEFETTTEPILHTLTASNPSDLTIKLLTFNTQLLPAFISQNKPEQRAIGIAELIVRRKYDIVCLQEVFAQSARNELVKKLKEEYPYIIVRSGGKFLGEGSGLFVASKFPILKHKFYPFNNSIGSDAWCQKGLLTIKFDLSALIPNFSLFVHTTHLQSNPDGSLPWLLSGAGVEKAMEIREEQLKMIRTVLDQCVTHEKENGRSLENISMVLCGDFHIVAEQEIETSPHKVEGIFQKEINKEYLSATPDKSLRKPIKNTEFYLEVIKSLANSINRREIKLNSASEIIELFNNNKIPLEFLGTMRRHINTTLYRERLLFLIEMICYTIRNELIEKLTKLKVVDETIATSEHFYREIVLYYFSLLLASSKTSSTTSISVTAASTTMSNVPSPSTLQTTNNINNSTHQIANLTKERELLAAIKQFEGEETDSEGFWKNTLLDKLIITFPEGLTEEEKTMTFNLQSYVHILKYQFLRSLERTTGLNLTADAWSKCIKQDYSTFSLNDIISIDFANPLIPFNVIKTQTNSQNLNDMQQATTDDLSFCPLQLVRTQEYEKALRILDHPRDLFREMNANFPGYTVNSFENKLEKSKGTKMRIDYIFVYDSISGKKLRALEGLECRVLPFGSTPHTQLSGHYSVEAVLKCVQEQSPSSHIVS